MTKTTCLLILALLLGTGCARLGLDDKAPLTVEIDSLTKEGPWTARRGSVRMVAVSRGGDGEVTYAFHAQKGDLETIEASGQEAIWNWSPKEAGTYRFKVTVTDESGAVADSGWSSSHNFGLPLDSASLYAVLPVDNLSGARAPLLQIHAALSEGLAAQGFQLVDKAVLEAFMARHRVRYTGGVSSEISKLLREEVGVDGIFITSLETWQGGTAPRVSVISRVVLSGEWPEIVWMDSVGLAGDDAPGLFGLGRIKSPERVLARAIASLTSSFQLYLAGRFPSHRRSLARQKVERVNPGSKTADSYGPTMKGIHRPKFFFRDPDFNAAGHYSVAVVPFLNINTRKNAGELVALHLVAQLQRYENVRVIEPGLVRQVLLKYRMIMEAGPSLAVSDILASENILGADLVLSGNVFVYQGEIGESKVDFSVQAFDGESREIIWASRSYATGEEGVYFFGLGRVNSAQGLTTRMSKAVAQLLLK